MYSNIGKKIQRLATVIAILGVIGSISTGSLLIKASDRLYTINETLLTSGIMVIILGSILSWVFSFVLYGFGKLVENSEIIARQCRGITNNEPINKEESKQPVSQVIRNAMDKGAIAAKTIYDKSGEFIGNQAQKAQARRDSVAAQQSQQYGQRPVQPTQHQFNYDDIYSTSTKPVNSQTPADINFSTDYDFINK